MFRLVLMHLREALSTKVTNARSRTGICGWSRSHFGVSLGALIVASCVPVSGQNNPQVPYYHLAIIALSTHRGVPRRTRVLTVQKRARYAGLSEGTLPRVAGIKPSNARGSRHPPERCRFPLARNRRRMNKISGVIRADVNLGAGIHGKSRRP